MSERPLLSVVIPVFEGECVIRRTIDAVQKHAIERGWPIEIVVGYSRGRDRTEEVLAAARSDCSNMTVVDTTAQFGKGGAVRGAMAATTGRVRCFIDADSGVSFDQIDGALELLEQYDIAIGSRYMPGGSAGRRPLRRMVLSRGGNVLMRLILGLRTTDTRAPLKVYRGDVADRLFPALRLNGFGFDSELLFLAGRLRYRIVEFPVQWKSGESSSVRVLRDSVVSILELFKIRWWWVSGRYAEVGSRTSRPPRR